MSPFRLLAHTADIGLEASASSRSELFIAAARGFRTLVYGSSPAKAVIRRQVQVEAEDLASLLVAWLNEILYLCEAFRLVPADFRVEHLDDQHLRATLTAEPFAASRHAVERTAKAVTYHRLVVEERKGGWYARVYIDL